jgi:hypothetical protein
MIYKEKKGHHQLGLIEGKIKICSFSIFGRKSPSCLSRV